MQAVGQLAGGIAHDFNNQLTGIMGYANMLAGRLEDERLNRYAENIQKAARRSADLTGQLLAFSRKGKNLSVPIDINNTLAEVVAILEHSIDKRIEIVQNLKAGAARTKGDPAQIQNAFLNLALNARDAMPEGGLITFSTNITELSAGECEFLPVDVQPGSFLQVKVSDTGTGIREEDTARIFEPFFTTKEEGKGTGMGLASVYGTVANHKGTIKVRSELGSGTEFSVCLPLIEGSVAEEGKITIRQAKEGARILLVDDEEMVCDLGGDILEGLKYKLDICSNGEEAVDFYRENFQDIDLVILDMVMPKMNGRDAFKAMKEINPDIKAILSSGYSIDGNAQEILDEGVKAFVAKPFEVVILSNAIAEVLEGGD
ncbi:MAG: ATP-binding protein [Planctomycetota bacterium]|jgi:CheY-like chemotaxis protein